MVAGGGDQVMSDEWKKTSQRNKLKLRTKKRGKVFQEVLKTQVKGQQNRGNDDDNTSVTKSNIFLFLDALSM